MILKNTGTVSEDHTRPAGKPGFCFYCDEAVGQPHGPDCVIPQKLVKVAVTVTYLKSVPAGWPDSQIEFQMNESSSCAGNLIKEMHDLYCIENEGHNWCGCGQTVGKVIGDPTEADLKIMPKPAGAA